MKKRIDYTLWVHSLPKDLRPPYPKGYGYLHDIAELYQMAVDSPFCFPIWMIDEFGYPWITLHVKRNGTFEEHTLKIDADTCDKIRCVDEYLIEVEERRTSHVGW